MRPRRTIAGEIFDNPILVGAITILIVIVAVYLSYIAENGLPFVPTYNVNLDVANAAELVKNADVRVGGARVGQVLTITPEPAGTDPQYNHPFARLKLALQTNVGPLPYDSTYQVRLASVLGGKYVEILPGRDSNTSRTPALLDGGTFRLTSQPVCSAGQSAPCNHNVPFVDLDTAFRTFGPKTQQGLRNFTYELGNAIAGRGTQFNDALYSFRQLIGPLENILRLLASPNTHLAQFISGAAATTSALAGVAPAFNSLLSDASTTFAALQRSQLGTVIDQLPPTESVATVVLTNAQPVLADAATLVQELKPSASLLPAGARALDEIVRSATPVFRRAPQLASTLQSALNAVGVLARDPAAVQSFKILGANDLASAGSSAFIGLGAILKNVAPAQFSCNVVSVWARNFADTLASGDSTASYGVRFQTLLDPGLTQLFEQSSPAANLHFNPYPVENASQCQAGNEGYGSGQQIGNPGQTGTTVDQTAPPAGVLARGQSAGLVP